MSELHFSQIVGAQAKKYSTKIAFNFRKNLTDHWVHLSWTDFDKQVNVLADALLELGVEAQNCVGQFSQNMTENLVVDFALYSIRGVMVPIYATSSASQLDYIVNDAGIAILFVGEQQQYDIALEVAKKSQTLRKIIVFDADVQLHNHADAMYYTDLIRLGNQSRNRSKVEALKQAASANDLACILYTSGTTGNPKGVMLPHSAFMEGMRTHKIRIHSVTDQDISIAFLPLSHVFERTWTYFCMYVGVEVFINFRPLEIQQTIKDVRPSLMCSVPRFWEKVYAGVQENISKMTPFKQGLVTWAVAVGKTYNFDYLRKEKVPPLLLKIKYNIADKLIFSKVKKTIGVENANMLPTAGAKLSDEINVFFRSIGIPIVYGYGLTETTATVTCFDYTDYEIGTVGTVMPDLEVKIGTDNEILVKGKTVFKGYYKNEKATREAFTDDGWFRTGDAGFIKNGSLTLTERIKDLFKTSNGKYIAPQAIETRLTLDPYIDQVATIGDERNYVTAIIAPSIPALEAFATTLNINFTDSEDLLQKPEIISLINERIKHAQKDMANYEMIKRFKLIKKGFTIETGELTNTLKMRRAVIMQKYKSLIDDMYSDTKE
ncbi:MAG: long-chain fatty acid--CoA ligase [Porphyromonadaceae bacterium CG2_30_38_12]|nr:MAG: long-chain fatty acid--CoA ligase [Porphyromonadaceae bacterium CG2_30_38_12]